MLKASQHRGGLRAASLIVVLVVVGLLAGGCVRVHAALAVSSDDLVSGTLVIAALPSAQDGHGPTPSIPSDLADRVTSTSYTADGYVGNTLTFQDLSFQDMAELATGISNESSTYRFVLQRNDDLVTLDGSVDLTELPTAGVDVQLKVSFPVPPTRSDGTQDGDTVTWTMKPGQVTSFSAADEYTLGNTHGWRFWAGALGGGGGVVSLFVIVLALWARRRNLKKERAYVANVANVATPV